MASRRRCERSFALLERRVDVRAEVGAGLLEKVEQGARPGAFAQLEGRFLMAPAGLAAGELHAHLQAQLPGLPAGGQERGAQVGIDDGGAQGLDEAQGFLATVASLAQASERARGERQVGERLRLAAAVADLAKEGQGGVERRQGRGGLALADLQVAQSTQGPGPPLPVAEAAEHLRGPVEGRSGLAGPDGGERPALAQQRRAFPQPVPGRLGELQGLLVELQRAARLTQPGADEPELVDDQSLAPAVSLRPGHGQGLLQIGAGALGLAELIVERAEALQGGGLTCPVAGLAEDGQRLLISRLGLLELAERGVDRSQPGEHPRLAGPAADRTRERQGLGVAAKRRVRLAQHLLQRAEVVEGDGHAARKPGVAEELQGPLVAGEGPPQLPARLIDETDVVERLGLPHRIGMGLEQGESALERGQSRVRLAQEAMGQPDAGETVRLTARIPQAAPERQRLLEQRQRLPGLPQGIAQDGRGEHGPGFARRVARLPPESGGFEILIAGPAPALRRALQIESSRASEQRLGLQPLPVGGGGVRRLLDTNRVASGSAAGRQFDLQPALRRLRTGVRTGGDQEDLRTLPPQRAVDGEPRLAIRAEQGEHDVGPPLLHGDQQGMPGGGLETVEVDLRGRQLALERCSRRQPDGLGNGRRRKLPAAREKSLEEQKEDNRSHNTNIPTAAANIRSAVRPTTILASHELGCLRMILASEARMRMATSRNGARRPLSRAER